MREALTSLLTFLVFFPSLIYSGGVTVELTSAEFYKSIQNSTFDAVIDVRRADEWEDGHIADTTFVENLGSSGTIDALLGCEKCSLAIYCRSGARAGDAIKRLRDDFNFTGDLYNGLGVKQWKEEGYDLVKTDSIGAPCNNNDAYSCKNCSPDCPDSNISGICDKYVSTIALCFISVITSWYSFSI
mmetsp:Transcript_36486/g.43983  ORF Transcript_36486/g.43983 Transcript_36486/m.43983 type:complete len:186 (-) Transcript_36486:28-585(-)